MAQIKHSASENDGRKELSLETHRLGESSDRRSTVHAYALDIEVDRNDSLGSKINRRAQVEAGPVISMGEAGEGWGTISIVQWWVVIKENVAPHVMASPFEMWEILMGWNMNEVTLPRRKLRIGMTGDVGGGRQQ